MRQLRCEVARLGVTWKDSRRSTSSIARGGPNREVREFSSRGDREVTVRERMRGAGPLMSTTERERSLAMFVDLENLAMGFQNSRKTRFEIQKVLERLVEKGKLIVKKAYADWSRYPSYTSPFHES